LPVQFGRPAPRAFPRTPRRITLRSEAFSLALSQE
jgi:hypothetical protein